MFLHAQQASDTVPYPELPPVPEFATTDITAAELRAHITWLASDAQEGRRTGTPGAEASADHIAREFARYGLQPAGENGGWFQNFEVITGMRLVAKTLLAIRDDAEFPVEQTHFTPYAFSASDAFRGRPVFAGHGIVDPTGQHDDYAGRDVTGAVVFVRAGYPEDADPHGMAPELVAARAKALAARERGASALLIVHEDERQLHSFHYDGSPADAGLPVGSIHIEAARKLFDLPGSADNFFDHAERASGAGEVRGEISGRFHVEIVRSNARNVIGLRPGTRHDDVIVIGAHYDHLGWGQGGSLAGASVLAIHNGADDNASGTAAVLELAQWFSTQPTRHGLLFMAFDAEELGLLGSRHWVSQPTIPLERVRAMINLDMIGRLDATSRRLTVQGVASSPAWSTILEEENDTENFDLALVARGMGGSDHTSFYLKDIPVLFFFTGIHADYHRPTDVADRIAYDEQETVTRYVAEVVTRADALDELPFTAAVDTPVQPVVRFNVSVGTIPDYPAEEDGFRISGTSPGSPAEQAGLQDGDVIIRFGDTEVRGIHDYMTALGRCSPGEDVPVVIRRDGEEMTLTVTPEKK
jgi:aminopeptidase YwaD